MPAPAENESPSRLSPILGHARAVVAQAWSNFHPLPALYCAPRVGLALAAGLVAHQPGAGVLAAAGAFSAGFGAFQRLTRFSVVPMLLASLCMAAAMAIGTVASGSLSLDAAVVTVAAFTLGLAASFGTGPWWVLLQGAIFLVIAGSQPGGWTEGASRGAMVLLGGVGETLLVALLRRLAPAGFPTLSGPNTAPAPATADAWLAEARRVFTVRSPEFRYALMLGLATGAATLIARHFALANGYWAAMTVLLIFRRGGSDTLIRSAQRVGGTLLGAAVATLIAALLRPDAVVLAALGGLAAWCAYATQWVNYGTFSISVTSYVAFLFAMLGLPETEVAAHRIVATLLGGAIGVGALALARLGRHARERVTGRNGAAGQD